MFCGCMPKINFIVSGLRIWEEKATGRRECEPKFYASCRKASIFFFFCSFLEKMMRREKPSSWRIWRTSSRMMGLRNTGIASSLS